MPASPTPPPITRPIASGNISALSAEDVAFPSDVLANSVLEAARGRRPGPGTQSLLDEPAGLPPHSTFVDVGFQMHAIEWGDTAAPPLLLLHALGGDSHTFDFILPSLARRGRIAIAASTGGASPALARWLRERLEEFLSEEVAALGDALAEVRLLARERDRDCAASCPRTGTPPPLCCAACPNKVPADRWQDAIDDDLLVLLRGGDYAAARARLTATLGLDQPLRERDAR